MKSYEDKTVIYHSAEDGCWLAHSIETDQIADGESVLEALENLLRGLVLLHAEAEKDPTIRRWRKAPADIIALAESAKPLPGEIYDTACKRVHGKWPHELEPMFNADDDSGPFATDSSSRLATA